MEFHLYIWHLQRTRTGLGNSSGIEVVSAFDAGRGEQARVLARCFTGPAGGPLGNDCRCVDFDSDGDVDLADYGAFQVAYGQGR